MESNSGMLLKHAYHHAHHLYTRRRRGLLMVQQAKLTVLAYHLFRYLNRKKPVPKHILILTGAMWLDELINNPNKVSFYENLVMTVPAFMRLKDLLEDQGVLYDSKYVTATKKLGILMYMLITGLSNRKLQQRFQRSASTISM
jgi:hypothetical protein